MQVEQHWYAIYTRPRCEKKAADALTRKKFEVFCPIVKVGRPPADRAKATLQPLFTSYVFVRMTENNFVRVLQTDGVLKLVFWLGAPAVIRDQEIAAIREFLAMHEKISLERIQVNVHDSVRVVHGPLRQGEGKKMETLSRTIKVYLPSLGYILNAEMVRANMEVVSDPFLVERYKAS